MAVPPPKHVKSFAIDFCGNQVDIFKSTRTGIELAIIRHESAASEVHICLATELNDDSGIPHTLEHLCFMGSEEYPYKGLLDKVASRSGSDTNATTHIDMTVYEYFGVGIESIKQTIPVYLDSLVRPQLTSAAFATEVYHVIGEGKDAGRDGGVVYSEMEKDETNGLSLLDLATRRAIFPPGHGLRGEFAGMLVALRRLKIESIREYHERVYRPENMRIVVLANATVDDIWPVVEKYETDVLLGLPRLKEPYRRPWSDVVRPKLDKTIVRKLKYPAGEAKTGCILQTFLGPDYTDVIEMDGLKVLISYLSGSTAAILDKPLLYDEPLASGVNIYTERQGVSLIQIYVQNIGFENLARAKKVIDEVLKKVTTELPDMALIETVMKQNLQERQFDAESDTSYQLVPHLLEEHVYATERDGSLAEKTLSLIANFNQLKTWTAEQWLALAKKWFDQPHVFYFGLPSKKASRERRAREKKLVKDRKEQLGEKGLAEAAEKLRLAKEENEKPVPESVFDNLGNAMEGPFKIPSTTPANSGLAITTMGRYDNNVQRFIDGHNKTDNRLFIHFEHFKSNFITLRVTMRIQNIPAELKPLLPIYLGLLYALPVKQADGSVMPYDQFDVLLQQNLAQTPSARVQNVHPDSFFVSMVVPKENYSRGVELMKQALYDTVFDPERVMTQIRVSNSSLSSSKDNYSSVLNGYESSVRGTIDAVGRATCLFTKLEYYPDLLHLMKTDPDVVIDGLNRFRDLLQRSDNIRIFVGGDVMSLERPVEEWDQIVNATTQPSSIGPLGTIDQVRTPVGKFEETECVMISMPSGSTTFASLSGRGPTGFSHPDMAALQVAIEALDMIEGPFWIEIRGAGLAYGSGTVLSPGFAYLTFMVSHAGHLGSALIAARKVIEGYGSGAQKFNKREIDSARAKVIRNSVESTSTPLSNSQRLFMNEIMFQQAGGSRDYDQTLVDKTAMVTEEDVATAIRTWLLPLFDRTKANLYMIAPQEQVDRIVGQVKDELKFEPRVRKLADIAAQFSGHYKLSPETVRKPVTEDDDDELAVEEACCSDDECAHEHDSEDRDESEEGSEDDEEEDEDEEDEEGDEKDEDYGLDEFEWEASPVE